MTPEMVTLHNDSGLKGPDGLHDSTHTGSAAYLN